MTERKTVHQAAADAETLEARPLDVLSIVLDAFSESAKVRINARSTELVRSFAYEHTATQLKGSPKMPTTDALRRAVSVARPHLRVLLAQQGMLLGTVDEVIRDMEKRVHYIATSGPEVDPPPPPPLETFEAAVRHMLKLINTTLVDEPFTVWPGHLRLSSALLGPFMVVFDDDEDLFRWASDDPDDIYDDQIICGLDDILSKGLMAVAARFGMAILPPERPNH
ncbi:hypothetical protein ACGFNU_04015 [Spirillospora sp. NPDC048911]|uniref:hypothetical protein n=1 Tax=Spirillospora sp. NPDC048911 TaxID=3364527 RepID=UPI003721776B